MKTELSSVACLQNNAGFSLKIIFSDKVHFTIDVFLNKLNCRIWGKQNPGIIVTLINTVWFLG